MGMRVKFRAEDGADVEGDASEVRYYDDDGTEVEGHAARLKVRSDDDEPDTEGHGPMFRTTTDDPALVAALSKAAGIEGEGEGTLAETITLTDDDGTEFEGHALKVRVGPADMAAVEGHAMKVRFRDDDDTEGHKRAFSDERLKQAIVRADGALASLRKLDA